MNNQPSFYIIPMVKYLYLIGFGIIVISLLNNSNKIIKTLQKEFKDPVWLILIILSIIINSIVVFQSIKFPNNYKINRLKNIALIGTLAFLTAIISNVYYTISLFYISAILYYVYGYD